MRRLYLLLITFVFLVVAPSTLATFFDYSSTDSQGSTTQTTFQDRTTYTFTPEEAGNYTVMVSAELHGSTISDTLYARMQIDGANYSEQYWEPRDTTAIEDYQSYITHKIVEFDTTEHTIKVQWHTEGTTAYIRRARIAVWKLEPGYNYTEDEATSLLTSSDSVQLALTVTPDTTQEYYILATGSLQADAVDATPDYTSWASLYIDDVKDSESNYEVDGHTPDDYKSFIFQKVMTLNASQSYDFEIQGREEATGANGQMKDLRLSALPATSEYGYLYNSSDGQSSTTGTITKTTLHVEPAYSYNYLFVATAEVSNGDDTSTETIVRFIINGTTYCEDIYRVNEVIPDPLADWHQTGCIVQYEVDPTNPVDAYIEVEAQGNTAYVRDARITALGLDNYEGNAGTYLVKETQGGQTDHYSFMPGTFDTTYFNRTNRSIVLNSSTAGNYTSQIFNMTTTDTRWHNISWSEYFPSSVGDTNLSYSSHLGLETTQVYALDGTFYLADMKDDSKHYFHNFTNNLTNGTVLHIYARQNKGVAVGIYEQSDTLATNPIGVFTVTSATGDWYNVTLENMTSITNAVFFGEGTGSGGDPKEEFDYIYASNVPGTGVTSDIQIQTRSCDDGACLGESFIGPDGTTGTYFTNSSFGDLNLSDNQYFQYKVYMTSDQVGMNGTPQLYNVTVNYEQDLENPVANIIECENGTDWVDCSNILFGNTLSRVRVNCTDDNQVSYANLSLENIPDSETYFDNQTTTVENGYYVFNNVDIVIADSGTWNLTAICVDTWDKSGTNNSQWDVPWGTLVATLITHPATQSEYNETQYEFFNFTSQITCTGGECGNINATLDPTEVMYASYIDDDAYVSSTNPNNNYGTDPELDVRYEVTAEDRRSYMKWNLDHINWSNKLLYGEMNMNVVQSSSLAIEFFEVYDDTWQEGTITWNNQPCGPNFDNSVLCDLTPTWSENVPGVGRWGIYNLTTIIQNTMNSANRKLSLAMTNNDSNYFYRFSAREDTTITHNPFLYLIHGPADSSYIDITSTDDAMVYNSISDDTYNYGASAFFQVQGNTGTSVNHRRSYLKFNVSEVTQEIYSAEIILEHVGNSVDAVLNVSLYSVDNDTWQEGAGTGQSGYSWPDITWANQPCGNTVASVGGDCDLPAIETREINASTIMEPSEVIWDVTDIVKSQRDIDGVVSFLFQSTQESSNTAYLTFDSKEGTDAPILRITYSTRKGIIPMNSGSPFYTITQNPTNGTYVSCLLNMTAGDSCNTTWEVNATGPAQTTWEFFTIYESDLSGVTDVNTTETNITIQDITAPTIGDFSPDPGTVYNESDNVTITVCVDEEVVAIVNITWDSTSIEEIMDYNGTNWCYEYTFNDTTWIGDYNVTIIVTDDGGNNDTVDTNFTVVSTASILAFSITVPGFTAVNSSNITGVQYTQDLEFNASGPTDNNVDACVVGGICQNTTTPAFVFTNLGNVDLNWSVKMNASLPSSISLKANTVYDTGTATTIDTSYWLVNSSIAETETRDLWIWADFTSATYYDSTTRDLEHRSDET